METKECSGMVMDELIHWLVNLKCNSFSLSRNDESAPNYMTVEQWIEEHFDTIDIIQIAPEELEEMKRTNTMWTFQVYPNTPTSFYIVHGATMESVLKKMKAGLGT